MTFVAPRPLEDVLVLDLSRVLAGPFATMMMADMGATVIKVEEPSRGDDTRGYGPPFVDGESTYFMSFNRNKRSIAIDMKSPEGRELVHKLALTADIVIENFRPGVAERMGLGYETLSKEKPSLIYVSVSGFGQTGPDRQRPGYDLLAQGMGGLMALTGPEDGMPSKVGVSQADLIAGLYAVQGALLALLSRHRTGRGQHVDVCLLDGQVSLLSFVATACLNTGKDAARHGNRHASIAPYQTYEGADGWFNVAVGNDRLFVEFAREVGRPDLSDDARFATNAARVANIRALNDVLEPIFKARPVAEWIEHFDKARIPAGPILTVKQVLEQPQVLAREMVTEVEHTTLGSVKLVGNPVKLSDTPARFELGPPLLGEHTEQILRVFLDMKDDEIEALEASEVVKQWVPPVESEVTPEHEELPPPLGLEPEVPEEPDIVEIAPEGTSPTPEETDDEPKDEAYVEPVLGETEAINEELLTAETPPALLTDAPAPAPAVAVADPTVSPAEAPPAIDLKTPVTAEAEPAHEHAAPLGDSAPAAASQPSPPEPAAAPHAPASTPEVVATPAAAAAKKAEAETAEAHGEESPKAVAAKPEVSE